jgi:hypothetical protein
MSPEPFLLPSKLSPPLEHSSDMLFQRTANGEWVPDTNDAVCGFYFLIVHTKLELALKPFYELVASWPNPQLDIVAAEFRRLRMWMFHLMYMGAGCLRSDIVPFPRRDSFTPYPPQQQSEGKSEQEFMIYIVYEMLKQTLEPFFADVLQNTTDAPFNILWEKFHQLSVQMLCIDNSLRADGLVTGAYHIIPFPGRYGSNPVGTGLPPLRDLQSIDRLKDYEVSRYHYGYYPSFAFPSSLLEAREAVKLAIGLGMKRPPPFTRFAPKVSSP